MNMNSKNFMHFKFECEEKFYDFLMRKLNRKIWKTTRKKIDENVHCMVDVEVQYAFYMVKFWKIDKSVMWIIDAQTDKLCWCHLKLMNYWSKNSIDKVQKYFSKNSS